MAAQNTKNTKKVSQFAIQIIQKKTAFPCLAYGTVYI